ncbi:hypothetical protein AB0I22_39120 [Streptomyces sp. NPDC050610]
MNVSTLVFGRGMFICAGVVTLYLLARALWSTDDETDEENRAS